jgi:hypothetical protein
MEEKNQLSDWRFYSKSVPAPYFHTRDQFFEDIIDFIEKQPDKPQTWPNMAIFG